MTWAVLPVRSGATKVCVRDMQCLLQDEQRAMGRSRRQDSWHQAGWKATVSQEGLATPMMPFRLWPLQSHATYWPPARGKGEEESGGTGIDNGFQISKTIPQFCFTLDKASPMA